MGDSRNDPTLILYSLGNVCIMGINYLDIMKYSVNCKEKYLPDCGYDKISRGWAYYDSGGYDRIHWVDGCIHIDGVRNNLHYVVRTKRAMKILIAEKHRLEKYSRKKQSERDKKKVVVKKVYFPSKDEFNKLKELNFRKKTLWSIIKRLIL